MPNGECHIGAENRANIKALARGQITLSDRVSKVETKQDWMIYLLVINLVTLIVTRFA